MPDGGYLIGGSSWTRAFLQKTDREGNLLWDERVGAAFNSYFSAVKQGPDGGYIALGSYEQQPNNYDLYLVKFAPEVPKPVADFSAAPRSGGAPLQVQFTDASLNSPTVWAWDFENDGVVDSTARNPVHIYDGTGIYTVSLTVANAAGKNGTAKVDLITVLLPLPGLTRAPTDPDGDGLYEDLDGDGNARFSDVVLFFRNMEWIAEHEPVRCFDLNGNGRIDFNDVVKLFQEL
jgi:PKD repeat protein